MAETKPTEKDVAIFEAIREMSCLQFFPIDSGAREAIMGLLDRMAANGGQIRWLTRMMVDHVGEWKGPTELRGIFCQRYRPLDGIEANSSHPRFSPEANESRALLEHAEVKRLPVGETLSLVKAREWPR